MSEDPATQRTLFLERQSYRRRRLIDGIKLVPILGIVLFFLPILWAGDGRTAGGLLFLFSAWALLIVLMAILSRRVTHTLGGRDIAEPGSNEEPG